MEVILAIVAGALFAGGLYLLLRRSMVRLLVGLVLLTNATNLVVFIADGLVRGEPAIIPAGQSALTDPVTDPLPNALILTAIVIDFAFLAFAMVLIYRAYQVAGTEDLDEMRVAEK